MTPLDAFHMIRPHLTRTGQTVDTLATLAGLPIDVTTSALTYARVRGMVGYDKAYGVPYTYVIGSN